MTTDFKQHLSAVGTESKVTPHELAWCGEDALLLYWDTQLFLVGILDFFVRFRINSGVLLVAEIDSVRIISEHTCELLEAVPDSTVAVFKEGSSAPGALLFDAAEDYENKQVSADEIMRGLDEDECITGIEQCLDAAMHEYSYKTQKELLQAASFGKLWVQNYDPNAFVDNCRTLRVLNAARQYDVGIPLTFRQFELLEAEVLIDRLINRHRHLLALRICQYLRHNPERVLVHWACAKIKASEEEDDEVLGQIIIDKLLQCPGLSFAKIATTAFHSGRRALATKLLEHEPLATDQVPLLISMKEDELALHKAIESGDTDLVYVALMHLQKTRPFNDFFLLIKDKPLARNLYINYCKQRDLAALQKFYYRMTQPFEAANVAVIKAYNSPDWQERLKGLKIALAFYEKSHQFQKDLTSDQIKLLEEEAKGEAKGQRGLVDLSVSELIERYIAARQMDKALYIKNTFNVPENRMWHLQVRTLAKNKLWNDLYALVQKNKKPPIGFQPFIEACVEHKVHDEAVTFSTPHHITPVTTSTHILIWICMNRIFTIMRYMMCDEPNIYICMSIGEIYSNASRCPRADGMVM